MSDIKIIHNQFIGIYENVLNKEDCNNIIELFEKDLNNKVNHNENTQFNNNKMERFDYQNFYESSNASNLIVLKINEVLNKAINFYANEFWIVKQLKAKSLEIKLQKTPPKGGFHIWHCEQGGYKKETQSRVLAWTVYLNDIPNGEGETEFLWQGLRVQPKAGTVSIFPAAFTHTHRGNPVYSCDKYIATGWYTLYE